jgi:thiazole synthase ThiGH ThiG subunit
MLDTQAMNPNSVSRELKCLLEPRLIVCVAGAYVNGTEHCLQAQDVFDIVRITKTNALVIHLPIDVQAVPRTCVALPDINRAFAHPPVPLLNTSRCSSAQDALAMIEYGLEVFRGPFGAHFSFAPLLKLEILDSNLQAIDSEVLSCLNHLPVELRERTLPILSPSASSVERAVRLGCPTVRLLSGRIGKQTGIVSPSTVRSAIEAAGEVPVVLEGGIDTADHIFAGADLGAAAVLVNSAFFLSKNRFEKATELRFAADRAWGTSPTAIANVG